jgi:two-component system response regulator MprA
MGVVRLSGHLRTRGQAARSRREAHLLPEESYSLLVVGDRGVALGLELQGHRVGYVSSGKDALERVEGVHSDALILDMRMSEVDGLEISRRIRKSGNSLPVLLLLPQSSPISAVDGFEAGADACLVGPFSLEELVARLRAVLRRTGRRAE